MRTTKFYARLEDADLIDQLLPVNLEIVLLNQDSELDTIEEGSVFFDIQTLVDRVSELKKPSAHYVKVIIHPTAVRGSTMSEGNNHYFGYHSAYRLEYIRDKFLQRLPVWVDSFQMPKSEGDINNEALMV